MVVAGWLTHLDLVWEHPGVQRLYEGLSRFARVIMFDKRGVGLSDRVPPGQMPSLEGRGDDLRAVLDAAGSERAYLFVSDERVLATVLFTDIVDSTSRATALGDAGGVSCWTGTTSS